MRAVNLIPADQRGGASVGAGRSEGAAYAVLALLAGLAVLAVLYGSAKHSIANRRGQAASLTAQAQRAQAEASQLAPYTSFVALRQQREHAVTAVVDSRFDWAHSFHELGRVLPSGVSVSSLTGTIGGAGAGAGAGGSTASAPAAKSSAGSSTPPGSVPVFTISGCATSQQTVALLLDRLRLMDGVTEVTLQSSSISGAAGGAAGGACPAHEPAYSLLVTFSPLPAASSTAASTASASPASTGTGVVP